MNGFRGMIRVLAEHPTAANLLMAVFLFLGLLSLPDLRRETFPEFDMTEVEISAAYPGASALSVETALCRRIEDAIEDVPYVSEVKSEAREGRARVVVEMAEGGDSVEFLNDIKTEVTAVSDFPDEVEDILVKSLNRTDQVVSIAVTGPMSERDLKIYCDSIKERLKRLPLVSQVSVEGFSGHQLLVEVPAYELQRLGLSIRDVATAVGNQSLDLPVGAIESSEREILLRVAEERRTETDLKSLVIRSGEEGGEVLLGDIAKIRSGFAVEEARTLFNGKRAGILSVGKTQNEDALKIFDEVLAFVDRERASAPPGVSMEITRNMSSVVRARLRLLSVNGLEGLFLVFLVMWMFFSLRFSFWVAMGLPVSFLGALFLMKEIGFTLNMFTMVGLLIATGLLMDDAIVISENVAAELEKGKSNMDAVVEGVAGVAAGVFSSFLTTVFIFGSLALFMKGDIGKVLFVIPVVLILTLAVSLVEAFFILPRHLSHSLSGMRQDQKGRVRSKIEKGIRHIRDRFLGRAVDLAVRFRYPFLGLTVLVFLLSLSLVTGGLVKIKAFPESDGDVLQALILLPQGTPLAKTEAVTDRLQKALSRVGEKLSPREPSGGPLVLNTAVYFNQNSDAGDTGPHVATVSVDLLPAEDRTATIAEITRLWREEAGEIPDVLAITFKEPSMGPGGLPIEIRLNGRDLDELDRAARSLEEWLAAFKGVRDLATDLRPGKPEVLLTLKKEAGARGFTAAALANQLRSAFLGDKAASFQEGGESHEVEVRLPVADRDTVDRLLQFRVPGVNGEMVPVSSLASLSRVRGWGRVNRVDGMRTVTVTGDVDDAAANAREVVSLTQKQFLPRLAKKFPGVEISMQGQNAETRKSMKSMLTAFLVGIFGVFAILSLQFRSYLEPLLVMSAIPFALIGVIWGHFLMGINLSMPSIMGFVSLSGIVVNDSILLVAFIREHLAAGDSPAAASGAASRERFRAVLLTSATTIMGLPPLLMERSMQAKMMIPLATSIVFGLMASTVLVLIVIPTLYAVLGDFRARG